MKNILFRMLGRVFPTPFSTRLFDEGYILQIDPFRRKARWQLKRSHVPVQYDRAASIVEQFCDRYGKQIEVCDLSWED